MNQFERKKSITSNILRKSASRNNNNDKNTKITERKSLFGNNIVESKKFTQNFQRNKSKIIVGKYSFYIYR